MKNDQNINLSEETTIIGTQNGNTMKPAPKQKKSGGWKSIVIGGAPGIILGTAGAAFAQEVVDIETQDAENVTVTESPVGTDTVVPQSIDTPVSETVNDDMNFTDAFDAARAEVGSGGIFEWHGNLYSTCTTDEWNSMSDEDKQAIAESASRYSNADNSGDEELQEEELQENELQEDESQKEDSQDVPENENVVAEEGENVVNEGKPETSDIPEIESHIFQNATAEQVEIVNVAIAAADNSDAELADVDNSDAELADVDNGDVELAAVDNGDVELAAVDNEGYVDGVQVDANDNGPVQENEVIATPDSDAATTELAMMSDHTEDSLYQDIPDYTNDADTSSLA